MKGKNLWTWVAVIAVVAFLLTQTIPRDIQYAAGDSIDLRNRVVGARLLEDGRDPYFYKWQPGDGIRYYDKTNFNDDPCSNISVSPFVLHLLSPIADWPQPRVNKCWLILEYLGWIALTVIGVLLARTSRQKQLVLVFSTFFLLTNGWKAHTTSAQYYLFIPLLAGLFYCCMRRKNALPWAFMAGLVAAVLVLVRPTTLVFLLPFALLYRGYSRRWWLAFGIAPLLLGGWSLLSRPERQHWQQYGAMAQDIVRRHQHLPRVHQINPPDPGFASWEGIDRQSFDSARVAEWKNIDEEESNVYELYRNLFHHTLPVPVLGMLCLGVIGILLFGFVWKLRSFTFATISLERLCFFGFGLYMLTDLFQPVYRHQYPTVQWLFPLLLAAATLDGTRRRWLWPLFAGILLNSYHVPLMKMRNTTGELLFLLVFLLLSFLPEKKEVRI